MTSWTAGAALGGLVGEGPVVSAASGSDAHAPSTSRTASATNPSGRSFIRPRSFRSTLGDPPRPLAQRSSGPEAQGYEPSFQLAYIIPSIGSTGPGPSASTAKGAEPSSNAIRDPPGGHTTR